MNPGTRQLTVSGRYDQALLYARHFRLPPGFPIPHPSRDWPAENIALLERYVAWLTGGGASEQVIHGIYIPMAGHVLGFNLKPHSQLDLDSDLQIAMEYIRAKQHGSIWTKNCRNSLARFRRFLLNERGLVETKIKPFNIPKHTPGIPDWLAQELERYQHIQQRNWRDARLQENIHRFWCGHMRVWRYLCDQCGVINLGDLKRPHLLAYIDYRLELGSAASTINNDMRNLHGFLGFLQQQEYPVSHALLHSPCIKQPDALPRFLTDEQVRALQVNFEVRVSQAVFSMQRRDTLLDRAMFYLLWQSGLRKGEVEELRLEDLDLSGKRLTVRRGKGLKDRTVYLTITAVQAVQAYLVVRGVGPTDHVFLYRNQALSKDLIHGRLQSAGVRVGIKVTAHQLRHTCATQLLNVGCRVTSIQKFLGHKSLNSTMVYARVHDQTVADDYYSAMNRVEKRLELGSKPEKLVETIREDEKEQILALAGQLTLPEVSRETRLEIAEQIRFVLVGKEIAFRDTSTLCYERLLLDHPPPLYRQPG